MNIKESTPIFPFVEDLDELSVNAQLELIKQCPSINLKQPQTRKSVLEFVRALFVYYFQIPAMDFELSSDLLEDVEKQVWAKELEVPEDEVTHGRLFTHVDSEGNHTGGVSDKGMLLMSLFMFDIADVTGIHVVDESDDYTFCAKESEFKSYYECKTVAELVDIIYRVSIKCLK
ncbi:hypothetical protein JQC92_15920 [Shewanella sp. 202IG2-18]|uniref:hypothetical protein n=1 Tax=Parashewanella hymeniacidonis TaxID=2807618 RepID=UPI00195FB81B|nr:hypothetical protein [Parashewanella hymeniacidonis]MBM7073502.1 hypothetical protein [Parashewanella hymeniacidonis]